jgi:DNA-directed RNA polymerase specialized sigma24 family protein
MLVMTMKRGQQEDQQAEATRTDVLAALAAKREQFFTFLRRRTTSDDEADDLLQQGFIRATRKISTLREVHLAEAWFYRILRRTIADQACDAARAQRAVEQSQVVVARGAAIDRPTCSCSLKLIETLPPQYAEILRRVDVVEESVEDVANSLATTSGNVIVRLHRARKALRERLLTSCGTKSSRQCIDCRCYDLA